MRPTYKQIYTVNYQTKKRYSKELAQTLLDKAAEYSETEDNKIIVLEKHYNDNKGNSTFELYKAELSAEEQSLYNKFWNMIKKDIDAQKLLWSDNYGYCCEGYYYFSDREIQDLFLNLKDSLNDS